MTDVRASSTAFSANVRILLSLVSAERLHCWILPLQLAFGHDRWRGLAFADKASGQAQRRNDQGDRDSDFFHSQPLPVR